MNASVANRPVRSRSGDDRFNLSGMKGNWFFTQDMLACLQRLQAPIHMLGCGEWNVNRINIVAGQEGFIAIIGIRNTKLLRERIGLFLAPARNGLQGAIMCLLNGGNQMVPGDFGGA